MTDAARRRLAILMYLQYAPAGAVIPFLSLRAEELGFTPRELAWASATQALAALTGPLVGQVADRWFAAERCMAVMTFLAGIALLVLANVTSPGTFFLVYLLVWLMMGPAITLGTSISFTHLPNPERDFGPARMWGTVGWVVSGWLVGGWLGLKNWLELPGSGDFSDALRLGGILAIGMSVYALTLPHTPPKKHAEWLAPLAALHLMRERSFAVYVLCTLGMAATLPFSSQVTPLLLEQHLEIPKPWVGPVLTVGQSVEIVSLALLPVLLLRFEVRGTMLLGIISWIGVMTVLAIGQPAWLVISSLALNGLCVCGYFVAGQVFVNSRARGDIRASAQALLSFCSGTGLLIGNVLVGEVRQAVDEAFAPTFAVAAGMAGVLLVVFAVGFRANQALESTGASESQLKRGDVRGILRESTGLEAKGEWSTGDAGSQQPDSDRHA